MSAPASPGSPLGFFPARGLAFAGFRGPDGLFLEFRLGLDLEGFFYYFLDGLFYDLLDDFFNDLLDRIDRLLGCLLQCLDELLLADRFLPG